MSKRILHAGLLAIIASFAVANAAAQESDAAASAKRSDPVSTESIPPAPLSPPRGAPSGQWVFTAQYGWLWMPYAERYVYVAVSGDTYMYVYYPTIGWRWVIAPWVVGFGPPPYWGPWGVTRFYWHSHRWYSNYYAGHRHHRWVHQGPTYRRAVPVHERRQLHPHGDGKSRRAGQRHHHR